MLLSAAFFGLMAATVKGLESYPLTEKVFFRNFLGFIFAFFMVKSKGGTLKGNNKKMLLVRSIFGMLGILCYFYSLQYLNLADGVIINKFSPFVVVLLSYIVLNEKVGKGQVAALILAIIGAFLVVKPTGNVSAFPALIGLLGAIFGGTAYIAVSYLKKSDGPETIVFYFTLITSICTLPFILRGDWILPTGMDLLLILGLGVFATLGQIFMTYGYRVADASEVSIYLYADTIFSAIIGFLIFNEIPDKHSALGGILIIVAAIINFLTKRIIMRRKLGMTKLEEVYEEENQDIRNRSRNEENK